MGPDTKTHSQIEMYENKRRGEQRHSNVSNLSILSRLLILLFHDNISDRSQNPFSCYQFPTLNKLTPAVLYPQNDSVQSEKHAQCMPLRFLNVTQKLHRGGDPPHK